jgi:hypothetical protein
VGVRVVGLACVGLWATVAAAAGDEVAPAERLRAHVEFLAGDALRGRASGSAEERIAAEYAAAMLRAAGLQGAATTGGFVESVELVRQPFAGAPFVEAGGHRFEHGPAAAFYRLSAPPVEGPLVRLRPGAAADEVAGKVVLATLDPAAGRAGLGVLFELLEGGAAAVLVADAPAVAGFRDSLAGRPPSAATELARVPVQPRGLVLLGREASAAFALLPEGTPVRLGARLAEPVREATWNAVAMLPGTGDDGEAVLLSAHLDHLGVREGEAGGDPIFNGADDDASGVAAVLELARRLAQGGPARRTLLVALYGSEEKGGHGSRSFREDPPVRLARIVANLQFEMLGRPDPMVPERHLWLTGFERSTLGPWLAGRGARLVADPRPGENFFRRSDNYPLAVRGVVAHTVSSFGLHADYHRPSDEPQTLDYAHLADAVEQLVAPLRALLESDQRPAWVEGGQPGR